MLPLARLLAPFALLASLAAVAPAAAQDTTVASIVEARVYGGRLATAETELAALVARTPEDGSTRLALGLVRFGRAVETLGQGLHRHGLDPVGLNNLPLFRIPVPPNASPEPLDYAKMRAILARFVADLDAAERTLAEVGERPAKVPLHLGRVLLDLDGDGKAGPEERLWRILEKTTPGLGLDRAQAEAFAIGFDTADAYWLRGYTLILASLADFWLAHDFQTTFDASFHLLFPRAGLPFQRELAAAPDALGFDAGQVADAIAFLHLLRWPVAEPERTRRVRTRLLAVIDLSRKNWAAIRAETDDDREWVPSPRQTGVIGVPVTDEQVIAWHATLDALEAILEGRKLAPHWRFQRGIDVRRVLDDPKGFDLVLWITGSGLAPYLADGEVVDEATFAPAIRAFGTDFLFFAAWFN